MFCVYNSIEWFDFYQYKMTQWTVEAYSYQIHSLINESLK